MKKLASTYKILLLFILLLSVSCLFAQTFAERALYRDSFASNGIDRLELINKYGSIHVKTWDKDSILISTDVYLSSTSKSKLEKLKEGIQIKYSKHSSIIRAQTIFGVNQTSFMKELQSITRSLSPSTEKRIEINYEVFMPANVALQIKNQYGDIFLGNTDQKVHIDQSNGSFKAENLNGETHLKFSFVNAMISDLKEVVLDVNYSNINLNKAINMNCDSKSSEIYADEIGVLKLKSSRDKLTIGMLDYAYGSASYSNIKILELNREIDGYFTYGQVSIDKVNKDISLIDIDSERTDIKLFIAKNIGFNYDILYNENTDVLLPTKNHVETDSLSLEGMKAVKGSAGDNPELEIRIRALKRCLVQIMHITN